MDNLKAKAFQALFLVMVIGGVGWLVYTRLQSPKEETYGRESSAAGGQENQIKSLGTQLMVAIKHYEKLQASGDLEGSAQELTNVQAIAEARKLKLVELMENDPEAAALAGFPSGLVKKFPVQVQSMLERDTEVTGVLEGVHVHEGQNLETATSRDFYTLKDNQSGKVYKLHFGDKGPDHGYFNSTATVKGTAVGEDMLVENIKGKVLGAVTGNQNILVILYKYTDTVGDPYPPSNIDNLMFTSPTSTAAFYKEASYGKMTITGEVTPWVTVSYSTPRDSEACRRINFDPEDAAATAAGYNLNNYQKIVYVSAPNGCSSLSSASIGGKWAYVAGNYRQYQHLYVHELGHAFLFAHANRLQCGSKSVDVYNNCTSGDYRDRTDVMGSGNTQDGRPMQFNAPHKEEIGWLSAADVQNVTTSGTYTIAPLESGNAATKVLKLPKSDTLENYYISYRQPIGLFDSQFSYIPTLFQGANIHAFGLNNDYRNIIILNNSLYPHIVSSNPTDPETYNAGLTDGQSFTDPYNGITITQLSHSSSGVTLNVQFSQPTCARYVPYLRAALNQNLWGVPGQSLSYTFALTNLDTPPCAGSAFKLELTVPAGWNSSLSASTVTLTPRASSTITFVVTSPQTATDGYYDVSLKATDLSDPSRTATALGSYKVYKPATPVDIQAPVVVISSPANGSKLKGASVTIKATATDNVGVSRMELYIDNSLITSGPANTLTYKWPIKSVNPGSHTISVRAFDAAGNNSVSSVVVTK